MAGMPVSEKRSQCGNPEVVFNTCLVKIVKS